MPNVTLSGEPFTVVEGYDNFWRKATAGRWEPSTFEVIRRCVDERTTVLDIGAWVGPTVLYEARRAKRVIAFEPDPKSASVLRQNLALNPAEGAKVTLHEAAIWTEGGERTMGNHHGQGDSTSSLLEPSAQYGWTVNCLAASEVVAMAVDAEKLFIKMDIEGAEYEVLPLLAPLFQRAQVDVFVAFHPHVVVKSRPRLPRTRAMTRDVFAAFDGFDINRVTRKHIWPALGAALAQSTGRWVFEAKDNYLFRRAA